MAASKVFFASFRARREEDSKIRKLRRLLDTAGFSRVVREGDLTAVKIHFGERGGDAYLNPIFARQAVDMVRRAGGKPFLTDTNTLYRGSRKNSADHLVTAIEHGYAYAVVAAPLIIADGLKSDSHEEVPVDGKFFRAVKIARDIVQADSMIVLSHFKGHLLAGFGGAVKNLAMGCASAAGKREQHSSRPKVDESLCAVCGACVAVCPRDAVHLSGNVAEVDYSLCVGCGECMTVCESGALAVDSVAEQTEFVERMAEYALGAVRGKEGRVGYVNFLQQVTPECDCVPWSDAPIVPDIGMLASMDPVALDKACLDMVTQARGNAHSLLECNFEPGKEKFTGLRKNTNPLRLLSRAEELGLGTRAYTVEEI